MQCRTCLAEIPGTSRFCPSCGAVCGAARDAALAGSDALTSAATAPPPAHPRPGSTDSLDQARFIPGTMLAGRYRIVSMIGRGGMEGEVYRAEDLKLGQPVALKFLPPEVANDADRLARFHQEVRVARQVSHPNVCRVYDIGESVVVRRHRHDPRARRVRISHRPRRAPDVRWWTLEGRKDGGRQYVQPGFQTRLRRRV